MNFIRIICFSIFLIGCGSTDQETTDNYREKINGESKYIYKSYPDKKLDSIWKFDDKGNLESVFTGDSTDMCLGAISGFYPTGELKYKGFCHHLKKIGQWYFFKRSGDLNSINFYTDNGDLYQRWFIKEEDTSKLLFPIIELEPRVAHVNETVHLRVNYRFDGIDTSGWNYFFVHDFIELEKFNMDETETLPYERFRDKYGGKEISIRMEFIAPENLALYGYTLAVHRETGDSVFHLEILEEYLTILDSTSVEL